MRYKKYQFFNIISLILSLLLVWQNIIYACPSFSKDLLRAPVGQKATFDRIVGAMHSGETRFEALKRLLKIKGINIEAWVDEQQKNMSSEGKEVLIAALKAIGFTETQIQNILDKIVLCEVPHEIRLEGRGKNAARIGGVIVETKDGRKILFPKDRIKDMGNIHYRQYLADLFHEVIELDLIEKGFNVAKAHEIAIEARNGFLKKGLVKIPEMEKIVKLENFKKGIENNQLKRVGMFGDQHGQKSVLEDLARVVEDGLLDEVVGHGDAFDRGQKNIRNFEAMKRIKEKLGDAANFCFGNHDIMLIQALLFNNIEAKENWRRNGGNALEKEFKETDKDPRELAEWMLQNFKLFYIDERGFLHIHAGIPMDIEGHPLISMEQLNKWQGELERIQEKIQKTGLNAELIEKLEKLFEKAHDIFWVREIRWINKMAPNGRVDQKKMDRFLGELGVNGVVFGHDKQRRVMNLDNRIFCLDVHRGDNGFMVFDNEGIKFKALARSEEDLVASKGTIIAAMSEEVGRLKGERQEKQLPEKIPPQTLARGIINKILKIGSDFNRWKERFELQQQLVSLGKEITPFLIEILRRSKSEDEKQIALDAVRGIKDEKALDVLLDILANNPDAFGFGTTAAYAIGSIGLIASPRLKVLLDNQGPGRNILVAIQQLKDESFVPLLKNLHMDDNETERLLAVTLLTLGDKEGLLALSGIFESAVETYKINKDESKLIAIIDNFLSYDVEDRVKIILKADASLESRLAVAISSALDSIEDEYTVQELIELLGLGSSKEIAEILWQLYVHKGGNEVLGRTIALAMKKVGAACTPFLTQGNIRNELIYEILGDIGDASAVPFLLEELKKIGYANYNRRKIITEAIEKIGEKAIPYLLEVLKDGKEDNRDICQLLGTMKSSNAIPVMIGVLKMDISESNKLNILSALADLELFGNNLTAALKQNPALKKTLFDLTIAYMKDGLDNSLDMYIERILKLTVTDDRVPDLINIYYENGTKVKKAVLKAMALRTDDASITFLINALSVSDGEIDRASLEALDSLAKSGKLQAYLKRNEDKEEGLISLLEGKIKISTSAISLLGAIGSERCLVLLINELNRKLQEDVGVDVTLLEALMAVGDRASAVLLTEHLELIAMADRAITKKLLSPFSLDFNEESYKDDLARAFKKWLIFIGGKETVKRPQTRDELFGLYLSQREQITALIIKLKEYLGMEPDATYEKIMQFIEKDSEDLSLRARVRFRIGVINYIRDRERICKIISEAAKLEIKDGDVFSETAFQNNPEKVQFMLDMLGFLPERIQIFFLTDTIHIVLDPKSYGRMRYRQKKHITGASDEYSKLLWQERDSYQDSGGIFSSYQGRKRVGGVSLSGLLTFESLRSSMKTHTLIHEWQHRFFDGYAADELREALLLRQAKDPSRLEVEINMQSGDEQKKSMEALIENIVMSILYDYQNEMISKIIDGNWIKDKDISVWFGFYKERYIDNVKGLLNKVDNEQLRQNILEKVFSKTEELLKKHKPSIDKIIELKAQLIQAEEVIDYDLALEKANEWTATFLQTIPITKFDRLDLLVLKLDAETLMKKPVSEKQFAAIIKAHDIGHRHYLGRQNVDRTYQKNKDPNLAYTFQEIAQKVRILKKAGFSREEVSVLIKGGVAGNKMDEIDGAAMQESPEINEEQELKIISIDSILNGYISDLKERLKYREGALARVKKEGAEFLIKKAEALLESSKSGLENAQRHIETINSLMKERTVWEFIKALKEVDNGAIQQLSSSQELVLSGVAILKNHPYIKDFSPEQILFVPESSWCRELFKFYDAAGMIVEISDAENNHADVIIIQSEIKNPPRVVKIIFHELIHKNFYKGARIVMNARPEEYGLFRILNESMTEAMTIDLIEETSRNPAFIEEMSFNLSDIENTYLQEGMFLQAVLYMQDSQKAGESIVRFLTTGDSSDLREFFGPAWKELIAMANKIEDYNSGRNDIQQIGFSILTNSMEPRYLIAEKLTTGMLLLEAIEEADTEDDLSVLEISFNADEENYEKLYSVCKYRAAIRLFKDITDTDISLGENREYLKTEFVKYVKEEIDSRLIELNKAIEEIQLPEPYGQLSVELTRHVEKFLEESGYSKDLFGGIIRLKKDKDNVRAEVIYGKIFFNEYWIDNLSKEEIERLVAHEAQHIRTDYLRDNDKVKLGGLYQDERFKKLQERIGVQFEKIIREKGPILAKPVEFYQAPWEALSLLRAYEAYLAQGGSGETQPYEFIEAFEPGDLKFLDEKYLYSITKDFVPERSDIGDLFEEGMDGLDAISSSI